jgi:hypothetical protein
VLQGFNSTLTMLDGRGDGSPAQQHNDSSDFDPPF